MIIGFKHGKTKADDDVARETTYTLVEELLAGFLARNASIKREDFLGHGVNTPEGMNAVIDKNLFFTVCPKLVRDAPRLPKRFKGLNASETRSLRSQWQPVRF